MVDPALRASRKNPGWFPAPAYTTAWVPGALTVAGQWRSFTAFPSILAIAVMSLLLRTGAVGRHGTTFHVINVYSVRALRSQNPKVIQQSVMIVDAGSNAKKW